MEKGPRQGGGVLEVPIILEHYGAFDHLRLSKKAEIMTSVQRPNTFSEANNLKCYAFLLHFAKCRNLCVKVLRDCPKWRVGGMVHPIEQCPY